MCYHRNMKMLSLLCLSVGLVSFGAGCSRNQTPTSIPASTNAAPAQQTSPVEVEKLMRTIQAKNDGKVQSAEFTLKEGEKVEVDFVGGGAGPVPARITVDHIEMETGHAFVRLTAEWSLLTQGILLFNSKAKNTQRVADINDPSNPLTLHLVSSTNDTVTLKVTSTISPYDGGP